MSTFGERLKELRKEYRLTQDDLAKILYLNKSSISKYENGKNGAENEILEKLADYFDVSIDYLLGRSDIKKSSELFNGSGIVKESLKKCFTNNTYDNWEPTLNKKDEKDIEKRFDNIINGLENEEGLMLNGEVLDDITKQLLAQSIKNGLEMAKLASKKKFTPKKYRKNEEETKTD